MPLSRPPYTRVTDHEPSMNAITVRRCRSLAEWLAASDAGKSLWHLSFGTPGQGGRPLDLFVHVFALRRVKLNFSTRVRIQGYPYSRVYSLCST